MSVRRLSIRPTKEDKSSSFRSRKPFKLMLIIQGVP